MAEKRGRKRHLSFKELYEYLYINDEMISLEIERHYAKCDICRPRYTIVQQLMASYGRKKKSADEALRELNSLFEKSSREISLELLKRGKEGKKCTTLSRSSASC
jgi:hypothetical protein